MKKIKIVFVIVLAVLTINACKDKESPTPNDAVTLKRTLSASSPAEIATAYNGYRAELSEATGDVPHADDKVVVTVPVSFSFPYTTDVSGYSNIDNTNIEASGNIYKFSIPTGETNVAALKNVVGLTTANGETVTITGTPNFTTPQNINFSNVDLIDQTVHLYIGTNNVASTTELASVANYTAGDDVDGPINTTMTGSVNVSYELSAKEESRLVGNGVSVNMTGTNVLFNDEANPVTDAVIAYYGDYFTEDKSPYVLSVPDEQTEMGDVTSYTITVDVSPIEGEKYFKEGNYLTEYNPSDDYMGRMMALQSIRQDTTYFDNTWTSDSTSYRDVNGDYITNLVLQREGK